jgi:hypothetical protein
MKVPGLCCSSSCLAAVVVGQIAEAVTWQLCAPIEGEDALCVVVGQIAEAEADALCVLDIGSGLHVERVHFCMHAGRFGVEHVVQFGEVMYCPVLAVLTVQLTGLFHPE